MQQVKAKKALGQHFLTDLSIAERIADSISSHAHLPVLEIGPGMGVLTQFLLEKGYDTHVIEIDTESVAYLKEHFPALEGRIIEGDFLKIPIEDYFPGDAPFALIGNYPYNISSQIFFRMLDYRERIPCCAGMLQREVAQRLASPPGNKDYGILSVLLQAWYDVEYLFTVDEHVFNPHPPRSRAESSASSATSAPTSAAPKPSSSRSSRRGSTSDARPCATPSRCSSEPTTRATRQRSSPSDLSSSVSRSSSC